MGVTAYLNVLWFIFIGIKPPSASGGRGPPEPPVQPGYSNEQSSQRNLIQQNFQNKLKELERLQYDLTKQVNYISQLLFKINLLRRHGFSS